MPISVDLTQLSGYESLAAGTYTITAVAKGNGNTYTSSNKSQGSSYTIPFDGYEVTITMHETYVRSNKNYFRVYDGQNNTGTLLYENTTKGVDTVDYTQSVTCLTGYLYIEMSGSYPLYGGFTTSGNLNEIENTLVGYDNSGHAIFSVQGNGTISGTADYDF